MGLNLRTVDLNLLVAFEALMQERHVTRAAARLGLGQPAMSAALARLRRLLGDDLLVKQGGEMTPTARALALEPEIRRLLRDLERILTEPRPFVPDATRRVFRLRLSDLLAVLLLPNLCRRIVRNAPGVSIEVSHLPPAATEDALERNDIELAVSAGLRASGSISARDLFPDRLVCVARSGHPSLSDLDRLECFVEASQIRVTQSPLDDRFVDRCLADAGLTRRIAVTLPHWLAVPQIVAGSDMIAVIPESIALRLAPTCEIVLAPPPLREHGFTWSMYWHRRHDTDDGHRWLRDTIHDVCEGLRDEPG